MRSSFVFKSIAAISVAVASFLYLGASPHVREPGLETPETQPVFAQHLSVMGAGSRAGGTQEKTTVIQPPIAAAVKPTASGPAELFPFRVLGRVVDGSSATVYLFGNGRVLKVTAAGPLDADYAVDAIDDQHLLLRHLRLNVSKTLELAPPPTAPIAVPKAEDYPQD